MSDSSQRTVREDVSTAFRVLTNAIESFLLYLNESGAQTMHQSSYERTLGILKAAKMISEIKGRLNSIEYDWNSVNIQLESSFAEYQETIDAVKKQRMVEGGLGVGAGPATCNKGVEHLGENGSEKSEDTEEVTAGLGQTIDREMAEAFLKDTKNIELDDATMITEEAARILSRHEGYSLGLGGLKTISASVAKSLAEFNGYLFFWRLEELSEEAATCLAGHSGGLYFGINVKISDESLMILARSSGSLKAPGVDRITADVARAFIDHSGDLEFGEHTIVSEEALEFLHAHDGCFSGGLHRFETISVKAAEQLVQKLEIIKLSSLTIMTAEVARVLGRFKGELWLDGLTSISDEVANELSKHVGFLNLDGVKRLSDHAVSALSRHDGQIWMHALTHSVGEEMEAIWQPRRRLEEPYYRNCSCGGFPSCPRCFGSGIIK